MKPTSLSERHPLPGSSVARVMSGEERRVVGVEGWSTVPKLEFSVEIWKAGWTVLETSGREVHGETSHLSGSSEEGPSSHRGELFETSFLGSLVLKPHLKQARNTLNKYVCEPQRGPCGTPFEFFDLVVFIEVGE